ncbi:MAG: thioredoxin domain-containing protein [Planctomycetes bacterium]|nr:thioredoxin domain-containing protein [Planctomycetota bacterium]
MRQSKVIPVLAVLFCATAALLSFHLLAIHLDGTPRPAWFVAGCSEDSTLGSDCAAVLASPYSYWPPKTSNEPDGRPHVPVALLGLLYYSVLTVWLIGVGRVSFERRFWHLLPVALTALGLLGSANFVAIMFTKIDEWCLWCLVTHALNLFVAICLLLMWPRRVAPATDPATGETELSEPGMPPHPSSRLIVTTLLAVWLALFGLVQFYGRAARTKQAIALKTGYDQCVATIKSITADSGLLLAMWQSAETYDVSVREDDPVRWSNRAASQPLEAVVFSDLECPSCKRLARFIEEDVRPLFDGRLRLVFKHYPLNRDCNPATTTRRHKRACDGARMVEAARVLGGTAAFWKAHDYLFARQDLFKRGGVSPGDVAASLGLDPNRFAEAMRSDAVLQRIKKDASAGKSYGVGMTPALFVSGRQVRVPARDDIRFWDKLADHYWRGLDEPRPPSTLLAKDTATTRVAAP